MTAERITNYPAIVGRIAFSTASDYDAWLVRDDAEAIASAGGFPMLRRDMAARQWEIEEQASTDKCRRFRSCELEALGMEVGAERLVITCPNRHAGDRRGNSDSTSIRSGVFGIVMAVRP